MKRRLLRTAAFVRAARKFLRKHPEFASDLSATLHLLEGDAFHLGLRTHKLKGELEGSWACSAGFDLRVLFQFVEHEKAEAILLLTVGSHEEVY